jgi:hypothetical protein
VEHHRDLCIVAKHHAPKFDSVQPVELSSEGWTISITVLSSIFWCSGQEVDPSPLSRAIGDFGLDGLSEGDCDKLDRIFADYPTGPWTCLVCVMVYTENGDGTVKIRGIKVLGTPEIRAATALAERMYDTRVRRWTTSLRRS